jgi:hypothetical protein
MSGLGSHFSSVPGSAEWHDPACIEVASLVPFHADPREARG